MYVLTTCFHFPKYFQSVNNDQILILGTLEKLNSIPKTTYI